MDPSTLDTSRKVKESRIDSVLFSFGSMAETERLVVEDSKGSFWRRSICSYIQDVHIKSRATLARTFAADTVNQEQVILEHWFRTGNLLKH